MITSGAAVHQVRLRRLGPGPARRVPGNLAGGRAGGALQQGLQGREERRGGLPLEQAEGSHPGRYPLPALSLT